VYLPRPRLQRWVRLLLVLMAVGLAGLFAVAIYLDPNKEGRVWHEGTHRQLGLPPCTFKLLTDLPCPSCGMSTSFAHLVRGDVWNSLQANFAGTMLAAVLLATIPWCLASACRGRLVFIRSFEWALIRIVIFFTTLMLLRWALVLVEMKWFSD
jgi:Protein of unknown function (DUF2752)